MTAGPSYRWCETAREYFDLVRSCAIDCESAKRQLVATDESWRPNGMGESISRGFTTDRSGQLVAHVMQRDRLKLRIEYDEEVMDEATDVIYGKDGRGGIAALMGTEVADVMWWRYLACESWARVGELMGHSVRWCYDVSYSAKDFIDAHGWDDVISGIGHAE